MLFQAELGVHLDDTESKAFAFACREGKLRPRDVRAIAGLSGSEAKEVLERLALQALISPLEGVETPVFVFAKHLKERLGRTDQVGDQISLGSLDLVTGPVQPNQKDLSTVQAASDPASLSTA